MSQNTQSSASAPLPGLRRGYHPSYVGYVPLRYKAVAIQRADQVWRELTRGPRRLRRAPDIAKAMGVSKTTAALLRRLFDALDLAHETPGEWNPDPFEWIAYGDLARSDGRDSDDGEGLSGNRPAILDLLLTDPSALVGALHPIETVSSIYVATQRTSDQLILVEDWALPSLRSGGQRQRPPVTVWWSKGRVPHLPEFVSEQVDPPSVCSSSSTTFDTKGNGKWMPAEAPPSVVIRRSRPRPLPTEHSEASPSLQLVEREPLTPPELAATMGVSLKTMYRRLPDLEAAGVIRQVARGRFIVFGQP